jgi:hypothetical protein
MTATRPKEKDVPEVQGQGGYAQAIEILKAELDRLREEVATLHQAAASQGGEQLPASAVVVADDSLTAEMGFYPVERTEDGVAFCWTGPSPKFTLDVAVDRFAGADLRLDAINFLDFERQKNIQLIVDGQATPTSVTRGGIGVIITASLPPRIGSEPSRLEFTLPCVLSPANTADTRQLGLAFFKLTMTART